MKTKLLILLALSCLFLGCSTRHFSAPVDQYSYVRSEHVQIENAQLDTEPRMFFSDGITTITTDYKGWSEILISKIYGKINELPLNDEINKSLRISINSIMCGGHYVTDCTITALVETGSNHRKLVTSDKFNGYPASSALNKALDNTARKIVIDSEVSNYLLN